MRHGEGVTALLMALNVLLILCAYYFIKPLREGWIVVSAPEGFDRFEIKAYTSFAMAILLIFVVRWYSSLSNRMSRGTLITRATLFCMSNMVLFWFAQPGLFMEHLPASGIIFYLWVGMFGVFVVAQFWAFAADLYNDEEGGRLIPLVAIGATSGAMVGSWIAEWLTNFIGDKSLLLVALVPLSLSIVITRYVDRHGPTGVATGGPSGPAGGSDKSGLAIVLGSRFLLAVAIITMLLNWVNTNGENLLTRVLQDVVTEQVAAAGIDGETEQIEFRKAATTAFYGNFYGWQNAIALFLQAFVASRLLRVGGFATILLVLPVISLTSYTVMALLPVIGIVKMMKIAENATDYSLNNTARHVLWLPVSSDMKYKGKPTVDALFVRLGDALAAATVLVGVRVLDLSTPAYFAFNVSLVLVWLALSFVVIREHRRISQEVGLDVAA